MEGDKNAERYIQQCRRYLQNADKFFGKEDYDKASEFYWGATAQAVKALAAKRGLKLKSHAELWNFVGEVAKETDEQSLYDYFRTANYLHLNFYEVELGPRDILTAAEQVKLLVSRLLELADKMERPSAPNSDLEEPNSNV